MISQGKLKKAWQEIAAIDEKHELKKRSNVAQTAKRLRLDINYTQCKRIAFIYYGAGMLNYLFVKLDESLEDYMKRTYHKSEHPYQFIDV